MLDLSDQNELISLLSRYDLKPDKRLGQNFLVDRDVLDFIVESAGITKDDYVLEVGPGTGVLTRELASRAKAVFACELDSRMTQILAETVGRDFKNVRIFHGDVFSKEFYKEFTGWLEGGRSKNQEVRIKEELQCYKIVSNLPYQVTSFFFRTFLNYNPPPTDITVMIQKEVAERMTAKPRDMNLLAISVQAYSTPKILGFVKKESFYPVPKVDSAVIHLDLSCGFFKNHLDLEVKSFFRLVKFGFSAKRKMLINNLSAGLNVPKEQVIIKLKECGIDEKSRAEDLSLEDWAEIVVRFK